MSRYQGGSPVPASLAAERLRGAARAAKKDGAYGFALACDSGANVIRELELENKRLRELLDDAEAKLGLRG